MALSVRNMVAGMSAREKRMAVGAGSAALLFGVFLAAFFVQSAIGDIEEENELAAETLKYVSIAGPKHQERIAEQGDLAGGREKPPPLRTLVDGIVKKIGMSDPDTKELPDQDRGDSWTEHGVEVSWREVSLQQLTSFMEDVEGNRRRFQIAITRLEIRKRRPGEDFFDITMAISTYENTAGAGEPVEPAAAVKPGGR